MSEMPQEVIDEFLTECEELIEDVFDKLRKIEKDGFDDDHINAIYRSIHTVKGSSQLFGFSLIGKISHSMETALDPVRHKIMPLEQRLIDEIYKGMELTSRLIAGVRADGSEPNLSSEIADIAPRIIGHAAAAMNALMPLPGEALVTPADLSHDNSMLQKKPAATSEVKVEPVSPAREPQPKIDTPAPVIPEPVAEVVEIKPKPTPKPKIEDSKPSPQPRNKTMESKTTKASDKGDNGTIRVNVNLLDNLMNRVGELVLIRNQVLQFSKLNNDDEFLKLSQRLNVVTAELQDDAMKTRMQPIGSILTKFHRVTRDLAKELGKEVDLELIGKDTELDKTLIEAVKDPLTHIVRNCVDHGLESTEDRAASGKPAAGKVVIKSYQEGGQIIIEIKDDGKGIDASVIGAKAVEKGVLSGEALANMSEQDIQSLIFAPGFSTAAKVSNISGRGVGMDVVKTNIEKIGGHVEVQSEVGKGTSMLLKIPLTLAIVPAMVVATKGEVFAVPQVKVVELVRVEDSVQGKGIEFLQGKPVYRLRGNLLPLLNLAQVLGLPDADVIDKNDAVNIIVINVDNQLVGLIVDEILDSADIVVKPLSKFLKRITVYSGATIMGDGRVILILDANGLTRSMNHEAALEATTNYGHETKDELHDEISEYLHFDVGLESTCSVPLCLVHRLEEFNSKSISVTGNQRVIKYRGTLLPLISVREALGGTPFDYDSERDVPVIVVSKGEKPFGLVVEQILDVVAMDSQIDSSIKDNDNMLGSVIYDEDVIVVIDALTIIQQLQSKFITQEEVVKQEQAENLRKNHNILITDDIAFFRNQVFKALNEAGYNVDIDVDGQQAFNRFSKAENGHYSLIVSDIEMPNLDGLGLAKAVRGHENGKSIPMIAVTTRSSSRDIEKGKKAGFDVYLEKLDPIRLVSEVDRLIGIEGGESGDVRRKSAN